MRYRATGTCEKNRTDWPLDGYDPVTGQFDIEVPGEGPADAFVEVALSVPGETEIETLTDDTGRDVIDDIDPDDPTL